MNALTESKPARADYSRNATLRTDATLGGGNCLRIFSPEALKLRKEIPSESNDACYVHPLPDL